MPRHVQSVGLVAQTATCRRRIIRLHSALLKVNKGTNIAGNLKKERIGTISTSTHRTAQCAWPKPILSVPSAISLRISCVSKASNCPTLTRARTINGSTIAQSSPPSALLIAGTTYNPTSAKICTTPQVSTKHNSKPSRTSSAPHGAEHTTLGLNRSSKNVTSALPQRPQRPY